MPNWKKLITSGSDASLSSLTTTGNISGSSTSTGSFGKVLGDGSQLTGTAANLTVGATTGVEAGADVTDSTNVEAAGALMDLEVTDLAGVKGVTISTLQVKPSEGAFANGDKTKLDGIAASANNYTLPTNLAGDDITIDTGALTGAVVISDLDFNVTTNTSGLVTDANGTVATRTLTLGDLGYSAPTSVSGNAGTATLAANSTLAGGLAIGTGRNDSVNQIVRTQGSGYAEFGWINTTSGNTTGTVTDFYVNTNDGYIRKATKAHVLSQLGVASGANNYSLPTNLAGDDIDIDTGALTGAVVISDIDFNITTNTSGLVTDANGTINTRTLTATNLSLGNVTNESKSTMFASPTFTGTTVAPTPTSNDSSTKIATTAYVQGELTDLIGGAPAAFDTLLEISASIANGDSDVVALTTTVGGKLAKASNLSDLANASTARTNLNVDVAGTDNSTNVSLAGTPDYITISGQTITRNAIVLTTDVTGTLPVGNTAAKVTSLVGGTGITVNNSGVGDVTVDRDSLVSGDIPNNAADTSGKATTAGTADLATTITITDNESTNEENAILFSAGADVDGGSLGVEQDHSGMTYNPSTGGITATQLKVGDGTDGYFYSDSAGRTAFAGGAFYIQSISTYYNYATNQYHGNASGDNHLFRGNPLSGNSWSITAAGVISGVSYNIGSTAVIDASRNLVNIGTIGSGAITSTAGFSGTTGTFSGKVTAASKSFLINHPTKKGKKLEHGSLEGPENGVYVRGKVEKNNVIELPEYWTGLVNEDTITVQLTPMGFFQKLYVKEIKDNKVYVEKSGFGKPSFFYNVYGERKDIEKIKVEY